MLIGMVIGTHRREFFVGITALMILAGGVIWLRTATVRDTYRYVKQVKNFQNLQQEIQTLRIEWLNLTAPKRLEQLAKELDLHPPSRTQVLRYVTEPETEGRLNQRR